MAQSNAFVDASHSLNELSHALALLESENSSLRGAVDGFTSENAKLRSQCADLVDERERLFHANVEKNGEILRLVGENAKLREDLEDQEDYDQMLRDRLCQQTELCVKAEAENSKLRELVRDYEHCSMHADCDRCEYDGTTSTHCPLSPCFPDIDELNELGVDVP